MRPDELAARLGGVQVVDVRYPNEWEAGRIEGSLHVPADDLQDRLDDLPRDRPIVAVCRSGSRSAEAAAVLADEGFDAENMEGGLEAWVEAGKPFTGRVVEPEAPPGELSPDLQRLQDEFLSVLFEVQEHFGETEPTDAEVRAFLRDRLIRQGRTPEEADRVMASLDDNLSG